MRYIQHKGRQKLHISFEIDDDLTHPVCGRKFNHYRASFNVPLGNACKDCLKRINSKTFNRNEFIKSNL
jgi:hypothetical protein